MSNTKKLSPEFVEKCKDELAKRLGIGEIPKRSMLSEYYETCAQIAVDYAEEESKPSKAIDRMENTVINFLQKQDHDLGYRKWYISEQTEIPEDFLTVVLKRLKIAGKVQLINIVDQFSMPNGSGYQLTMDYRNELLKKHEDGK